MARARRSLILLLALPLLVAACGDDDEGGASTTRTATAPPAASRGVFAGKVPDSDAYIAIVSDGKYVAGYVCDGQHVSTWFKKTPLKNASNLVSRQGEIQGTVKLEGDSASGNVSLAGSHRPFTAKVTTEKAGLYRALKGETGKPGSTEAGWIVLADGSQRGATNVIDQNGGLTVQPAPKLQPGAGTASLMGVGTVKVQHLTTQFIDPTTQF